MPGRVDIPVIGLGEVTMLHACTLGQTFGLITINPVFISWHREQIVRLGLQQRAAGVRALDTQVATYMQAFETDEAYQRVKEEFGRHALQLVEAGAEVTTRLAACRCCSWPVNATSRSGVRSC